MSIIKQYSFNKKLKYSVNYIIVSIYLLIIVKIVTGLIVDYNLNLKIKPK